MSHNDSTKTSAPYSPATLKNNATVSGNLNVGGIVGKAINTKVEAYNGSSKELSQSDVVYNVENNASVTYSFDSSCTITLGETISYTSNPDNLSTDGTYEINYSASLKTTIASANYQANVGGIVGYLDSANVRSAKNTGDVVASSVPPCGGTQHSISKAADNGGTITVNSGAVSGFGGIAGRAGGTAAIASSTQHGGSIGFANGGEATTKGVVMVGGIVGYLCDDAMVGYAAISNTTNDWLWSSINQKGAVDASTVSGTVSLRGAYFIGAAVGYAGGSAQFTKNIRNLVLYNGIFIHIENQAAANAVYLNVNVNLAAAAVVRIHFKNAVHDSSVWTDTIRKASYAAQTCSPKSGFGCLALNANGSILYGASSQIEVFSYASAGSYDEKYGNRINHSSSSRSTFIYVKPNVSFF